MEKNKAFNFLAIIKKHRLILIFAFIGAFLVALPMIASILNIGFDNFKGVYPVFNPDKTFYMSMTKEIIDGHPWLGNPFIKEHKDMPFMYPPVSEILLAGMSKLFLISIPALFAVNDFVLPFIEILLLYYLFYKISRNKILSSVLAFSFVIMFAAKFAMPINPQLSFIYLTLGVIIVWKMASNNFEPKKCFRLNIALSAPFLLAFYTYPYFWTGILVLYGMNLLFFSIKRRSTGMAFRNLLPFFAVSIIFTIPYFINLSKAASTGLYGQTMARLGLYSSHIPACFTNVSFIFLAFLVLFFSFRIIKDKRKLYFSIALLLSAVILNWQNVITGKTIQFSSHYFQLTIFYCLIVGLIAVNYIIKNKESYFLKINIKKIITILLLFLFIVILSHKKIPGSLDRIFTVAPESAMAKYQSYAGAYEWFNNNTELDSSIFIANNPEFNLLIPVYTHNNVLNFGYNIFLMADEEAMKRWLIFQMFNDNINEEYFKKGDVRVWSNKYVNEYQNTQVRNKIKDFFAGRKKEYDNKFLPEAVIEELIEANKNIRDEDLAKVLRYFELDYFVIDKRKDNFQDIKEKIEMVEFAEYADEINSLVIYKIK